jgi:hypothetical protein
MLVRYRNGFHRRRQHVERCGKRSVLNQRQWVQEWFSQQLP